MSTEPKPATAPPAKHDPKPEPNALASSLTGGWDKFKQGKLISYPLMALILVVVAGIGVTVYITRANRKAESAKWVELTSLNSVKGLEEFATNNPGTVQGRLAALDVARVQLGPEGIELFAAPNADVRKKAVESVEKARDTFAKLVDEFKDDPVIKPLCMLGCAKAEVALVGMPKEGQVLDPLNPTAIESHGDPKKAVEWLDKVAEAAPETPWGKQSKELADTLRNQNTQQQVITLQASAYSIATPTMPGMDPKAPRDPAHGFPGLPPGFGGP